MLGTLEEIYANINRLISEVEPDQRFIQTPCADWNTHELINHMTGSCNALAAGARRETPEKMPDEDHLGDLEPAVAFAAAAEANLAAWSAEGALEGMITVPAEMPAVAGLGVTILDLGTHCWDLAKTIDADHGLSENTIAMIDQWNRDVIQGPFRDGGAFGEILEPTDTDSMTQMLAFVGRRA